MSAIIENARLALKDIKERLFQRPFESFPKRSLNTELKILRFWY